MVLPSHKDLSVKVNVTKMAMNPLFKLIGLAVVFLMLIAFLYDPDGSQVGPLMFGESALLLGIGTLIGDIAWLLGIFLWIGVGSNLMLVTNPKVMDAGIRQVVDECRDLGINPGLRFKHTPLASFVSIASLVVAIIGVASGFWFTATAWTIMSVLLMTYRKKAEARLYEIIQEDALEGAKHHVY